MSNIYVGDHVWVENDEYNAVQNKQRTASLRRAQADRELAAAQAALSRANAQLGRESAGITSQLNAQLAQTRAQLSRDLTAMDERMHDELRRLQTQMDREIDTLRREASATNRRIDDMSGRIDSLSRQMRDGFARICRQLETEREQAVLSRNLLETQITDLERLHGDKLLGPTELHSLRTALNFAQTNIDQSLFQASIGVSQNHLIEATRLRARLAELNEEYRQLSEQIESLLSTLSQRFDQLTDIESNRRQFLISDQEFQFDGDFDFWTYSSDTGISLFSQLFAHFERLYRRATEDYLPNMNLRGLRAMLDQLSPISGKLDECIRIAHGEFQVACQVLLTADQIDQAMCLTPEGDLDHNWSMISETHTAGDPRRSYEMRYQNGAGDLASFVVLPDKYRTKNQSEQIRIRLDICNDTDTPDSSLCHIIYNEVSARLSSRGIRLDEPDKKDRANTLPAFSLSPDAFTSRASTLGDNARATRLSAARTQMKL